MYLFICRQAMEPYNFPVNVKKTLLSFPLNQVNTLSRERCKCCPALENTETASRNTPMEDVVSNGELLSDKTENNMLHNEVKTSESVESVKEETMEEKMETIDEDTDGDISKKRKLEWVGPISSSCIIFQSFVYLE